MKSALLLILLIVTISINCQELSKHDKKQLKEAGILLENKNYIDAYDIYWEIQELSPDNPDMLYGIGVCKLFRRGEEKSALPYLLKSQKENKNRDLLFYLAKAYHVNHQLNEAKSTFEIYLELGKGSIDYAIVNREIQTVLKAKELIANPRNVDIQNLGNVINSEYQDAVPVMLPNQKGIFFTSRRPVSVGGEKDYLGNYYQDIYYANYVNFKWQTPVNVTDLNSKLHDASVGISQNGSTFISYRTNENFSGGDLYHSDYEEGEYGPLKKFSPTINSEYQELSATFSPDENTLYFSSNRPGGYGGLDLYKSKRLPNGKWGIPTNLGPNINTEKNEDSPFMSANGRTLYFSSDGHLGMGGYDIFESTFGENKSWSTPKNIGYPINTVGHDIYLTISADGKTAYYSSARAGGFGQEDIYHINMLDNEHYQTVINCEVFANSLEFPLSAKITVFDETSHKMNGLYRSNIRNGNFIMIIQPEVLYQVVIEADGYESQVLHMSFAEENNEAQKFILKSSTNE